MRLTDEQYMGMARMAKEHADCKGRHVGAALVLSNGAVLLGANGSPIGHIRCEDGGCYRCANREVFLPGKGYDVCTCVHAEEACLAAAARHGVSVDGGVIYSTMRPCRECSKQMLQAGITAAFYEDDLVPTDAGELDAYLRLQAVFPGGVHQVVIIGDVSPAMLPTEACVRVEVPLN